jgi:DNA-binding MarR family transcriptional regulator
MNKANYKSNLNTNERVLMGIVRLAEKFKRVHSAVFRNYGLSFPQYNVLRVLEASAGGRNRIGDVGKIMIVPVANLTRIAKGLQKEGFIKKRSDPADDRVTILEITAKGKQALKRIENEKDDWLERMLGDLSEIEKLELLGHVRRILKTRIDN